jgi:predicted metal-dependent enzyme (double-stranded beta helix superfamily)
MFELDRFIADCRAARADHLAVRDVVARAVEAPEALVEALGAPQRAGVQALYRSDELTVLNLVWGPRMMVMPHNHEMWAVIGIYTGREDNIFWRRLPRGPAGGSRRPEPGRSATATPCRSGGTSSTPSSIRSAA